VDEFGPAGRTVSPHDEGRRERAADRDRGVTLVELLVSMTLLSMTGVAVLVTVAASARAASVHHDVATVQSQLASVGDHLMSTDAPFESCAAPAYRHPDPLVPGEEVVDSVAAHAGVLAHYRADVASAFPALPDVRVADVSFWDGTTETWGTECWALFQGDRIQKIRLEVTGSTVQASTLEIVKRPPSTDEPAVGVVTPPPLGSGGATGGAGGSFTPNPCLTGCSS
jgi:hypothetical protein